MAQLYRIVVWFVRTFTDDNLPMNSKNNFWDFDRNTHKFSEKTIKFWYKFYWSTRELTRELYLTKLMVLGAGPAMYSKCI